MNTHVVVSETHRVVSGVSHGVVDTHIMVTDLHRNLVKGQTGQEAADAKTPSVSDS